MENKINNIKIWCLNHVRKNILLASNVILRPIFSLGYEDAKQPIHAPNIVNPVANSCKLVSRSRSLSSDPSGHELSVPEKKDDEN